jgi:tripartite-type tricarboxylate transporter receptor subunit TctC
MIVRGWSIGLVALSPAALAQYPSKPIRVIVPVPAGGTPDVVARMVAPGMGKLLGQNLVIDNRGGAGTLIGTELAARAAADGYTLLVSSGSALTIHPHLMKKLPFDPNKDFVPVSLLAVGPFVMIVHPAKPYKSVAELTAMAKAAPSKFNYASAGNGTPNHLAMELFKRVTGTVITHVPYKGAPQSVTDVLGNQIDMNLSSLPPVLGHIRAARLQALAVTGAKRSAQLPDTPTLAETVAPGYEFTSWFGLWAPSGVDKRILTSLHEAVAKVVHAKEMRAQFDALGSEAVGSTPEAFNAFIRREFEKNGQTVAAAKLRAD